MITDPHIALELNKSMLFSWLAAIFAIKTQPQQWQRLYSNSIPASMIIRMETTQSTFAMYGSFGSKLSKGVHK